VEFIVIESKKEILLLDNRYVNNNKENNVALVLGAGASSRMGGQDKIFISIFGKPLLYYSLTIFEESPLIDSIVLVMSQKNIHLAKDLVRKYELNKVKVICLGGDSRFQSVENGLKCIEKAQWVLVHDAARPCITQELLEELFDKVQKHGSAICGRPVFDTLKSVNNLLEITSTVDRNLLWTVQTPQVFRFSIILDAYKRTDIEGTDDSTIVEQFHPVNIFCTSPLNLKVTVANDIPIIESILKSIIDIEI